MLFNTSTFLIFFLIFVPFYLLARRLRVVPHVVVFFSQIFYGWWDWRFLSLLWITIFLDYYLALRVAATSSPRRKQLYLASSIAVSLTLLGFFKYWNFLVGSAEPIAPSAAAALHLSDLILPVGISFYTFQSMSYIVDVYRGVHPPVRNLFEYASFVCYFPHLVAGPIQRLNQLLPQIVRPGPITVDKVLSGVVLFSYGFLCKSLGDTLATLHDPIFANLGGAAPAAVVLAIFSFGMQIYLDFSGYSEMARGISRAMGIELMRNFRAPYVSTSFREFWHRWHISLSQWLRDYLYIPLGGNRGGSLLRYRNLMITMVLGGLWHGAGWSFLIWGGLHGLYLVLNTLGAELAERLGLVGRMPRPLTAVLGWVVTFLGVNYAWLYFRVPSFGDAMVANQKILQWLGSLSLPAPRWELLALLVPVVLVDLLRRRAADLFPLEIATSRRSLAFGLLAGCFVTVGLVLLIGRPSQQFIYFQF